MGNAVGQVEQWIAQKVRDFFPFSPAKTGPLSGRGYVSHSGIALARDFAKSIESGVPLVVSASRELTEAVNVSGAGLQLAEGNTHSGSGTTVVQHIDARGADADSVIRQSENRLLHALGR